MNYEVKSIDYQDCKEWFLKKHYAKRIPSISFCFGLYSDKLEGVCSFGKPASPNLCESICGVEYKELVYELNRLVVNDGLPKNTLSYFVSKTLKLLPELIIVSFADAYQGHHGYIYQATNWIYTGEGAGGTSWAVKGLEHLHHTSIEDSVGRYEDRSKEIPLEDLLRKKYGDKLYKKQESPKHRYFFFLGNNKDVKIMKENLKYKILPYPKGDNKRYDASYKPQTQKILL